MKEYSDAVNGIKSESVEDSATAAKALMELATNLPSTGGIFSIFTGEADMEEFGNNLVPFGEAMKKYSDSIDGIKAKAIADSATAGTALMELSQNIPETGGYFSLFTGEADLEQFGNKLVPFGEAMKEYSVAVEGIKVNAVQDSANAAKSLTELASNIPVTGGIWSVFSGDNDIQTFGTQLKSFGDSLSAYYDSIININFSDLDASTISFGKLIDVVNGVAGLDSTGMSAFAQNLTDLGNAGVDGFIDAFINCEVKVKTAANTMLNKFTTAFEDGYEQINTNGQFIGEKLESGISGKQDDISNSAIIPAAKGSVSGSIVVYHNNDGSKDSVPISFTTRVYYDTAEEYAGDTISLTKIKRYTISYDSNGGTSVPASQTKIAGVSLTLAGAISRNNSTAYGYVVSLDSNGASTSTNSITAVDTIKYTFAGWNTNSSGSGDNYAAYGTFTKDADTTLYAKWSTTRVYGTITLPTLVRTGYIFKGWSETKTVNSGVTGSYTPTKNVTLYAMWEARGLVHIDNGSKWEDYQIYIDNGSSWDVYAPYIDTGASWELYS